MANTELEKLYSPSQWVTRIKPSEAVSAYINAAQEALSIARQKTSCSSDIPYGSSKSTKYDIYGTDLPDDAPIFIFIHGGYWQELSKELVAFPIESCVSNGIKVICPGYDLCPEVRIHDIVQQIRTLVEMILGQAAKWGSRGVWIGGHSAGAHLAASLLDPDWFSRQSHRALIKGLILIAGIYYLEPLIETTNNNLLKLDSDEARIMSTLHVEFSKPVPNLKVIVVVGESDSPVFIQQSQKLSKELQNAVDNVEYLLLRENIDHFDIVEKLTNKNFILTKHIITNINSR